MGADEVGQAQQTDKAGQAESADQVRQAERLEASRVIAASPARIFALLCDPAGHVAIDSSGMLQSADGDPVCAAGDSFVVHMDREALGDRPLGRYDVTVEITRFEQDILIEWTPTSPRLQPSVNHHYGYRLSPLADGTGTEVTSYYDWSRIHERYRAAGIFPLLQESALRATLGILARTVERQV
ncbi:polyketide cyclase [Streptomyces sp. ME02-8801-2C]|uniref:SRPBCC family protein n=1 Tax=Streptomyces sp. ME02-8801-2C TaxID=3028680 RepID=UPI0029B23FEC|nr:SRPBCC family protein [Streptomyces sp. ME02-8801-2C]MDX3456219.1 polyketide cyclase [Streptomyces sp. ME02-8801-2C]